MTRRQLGLFGDELGPKITDHDALVGLAARLPPHVRFGTSSWTFRGWGRLVYAETDVTRPDFLREALAEYARHPLFRTVGIDRSFYAPIPEAELRAYALDLPEGFRAVSKIGSEISTPVFPKHERFRERAGQPNPRFLDASIFREQIALPFERAFAAHRGPFVLEIPPSPVRLDADAFAEALARFFTEIPEGLDLSVELRDPRLMTPRYFEVLAAHGATHCFNLWTRMPSIGDQLARPGALRRETRVVARLMVPRGKKYEVLEKEWAPFDAMRVPDEGMRADVARLVHEAGELGTELYVIANNKAEGCAPLTVRALAERIARP
ncbi:MAG: DUF72 domain-containing protein [Sandaracinus sp.]